MHAIPVFIEAVPPTADSKLKLCQRIIGQLNAMHIAPLHFAASPTEAVHLIGALDSRNTSPALIILNAYGLEEHQSNIECHFMTTPMLVFERPLSGKPPSGVRSAIDPDAAPRSRWNFGPLNALATAQRATFCIEKFLRSGMFQVFNEQNDAPVAPPPKPRKTQTDSKPFFGMV